MISMKEFWRRREKIHFEDINFEVVQAAPR